MFEGGLKNGRTGRESGKGDRSLQWHTHNADKNSIDLTFEGKSLSPRNWHKRGSIVPSYCGCVVKAVPGTEAIYNPSRVITSHASSHYKSHLDTFNGSP